MMLKSKLTRRQALGNVGALLATAACTGNAASLAETSDEELLAFCDGKSDCTAAIQKKLDAHPDELVLPRGTFLCGPLSIPSHIRIRGAGRGATILLLRPGANRPLLVNSDAQRGNVAIQITDLTLNGNAARQSALANGVVFDKVRDSRFDIEVTNCRGSGLVIAGGGGNWFGPSMRVHGNGVIVAGYGLYIYGSDDNRVEGGEYDNNCIGIAVEASGRGTHAKRNRIIAPLCRRNRADFGQSGAGVHFEQTLDGDCDGCVLENPTCTGSTGVGVNNTGCNLVFTGGSIAQNRESAVTTIAAADIRYEGIRCENNALGQSNGYRGEMRFDDGGLVPGTSGTVSNCVLRGSAPDGGMRTMSPHSAIRFIDNDVRGYRWDYIVSGKQDSVRRK